MKAYAFTVDGCTTQRALEIAYGDLSRCGWHRATVVAMTMNGAVEAVWRITPTGVDHKSFNTELIYGGVARADRFVEVVEG